MRSFTVSKFFAAATASMILFSVSSASAPAKSREQVVYAFSDCGQPAAPLIADRNGNLYGTTSDGGTGKSGCVFELSPNPDGSWSETLLHTFNQDGRPSGGLVFDNSGNLYGTAGGGGNYGGGVVYELSPSPQGEWTETILYNFGNGSDGMAPGGELIFDNTGKLYGTTENGGKHRGGTVFKLSPSLSGWTETILYQFWPHIGGPGGDVPMGGLVMDQEGNLYGVTEAGGAYGYGAVYELSPKNGGYGERLIHSFDGYDGALPKSGLVMDSGGNLYGTTAYGGISDYGIVFRLTRGAKGKWTESVVHYLDGNDGINPVGPVFIDGEGNLYAAAMSGGLVLGQGTVLMFSPERNGSWRKTVLHRFHYYNAHFKTGKDGLSPYAGVILNQGALYGTTAGGGVNNAGTVFSITF